MECRCCAVDVITLLAGVNMLEDTLRFYRLVPPDDIAKEQIEILKTGVSETLDDLIERCELPPNSQIHQVKEDLRAAITLGDTLEAVEGLDGKLYDSLKV